MLLIPQKPSVSVNELTGKKKGNKTLRPIVVFKIGSTHLQF